MRSCDCACVAMDEVYSAVHARAENTKKAPNKIIESLKQ